MCTTNYFLYQKRNTSIKFCNKPSLNNILEISRLIFPSFFKLGRSVRLLFERSNILSLYKLTRERSSNSTIPFEDKFRQETVACLPKSFPTFFICPSVMDILLSILQVCLDRSRKSRVRLRMWRAVILLLISVIKCIVRKWPL